MRIDKVRYKNYCQHASRSDKISPGVVGIIGANGSGKSNWLKGILRAFTGKTVNMGKNEDDVSWGESTGEIEVWFTVCGTGGRIKRNLKTRSCSMEFGGEKYKSATAIEDAVYRIIGVSPKLLQEVVFAQQGEIEAVLFQRDAERKHSLQALFGTERAELMRTLLQNELTNNPISSRSEVIKELEAEARELGKRFDDTRARLDGFNSRTLATDKVAELQRLVHSADVFVQAREELRESERKLADFRVQYDDAKKLKAVKEEGLAELEDAAASVKAEVEDAKRIVASSDACTRTARQKADIERRLADAKAFLEKAAPENPSETDFSELEELQKKLAQDKHTLEQWRQFLQTFQGSGSTVCPTCFQRVNADAINRVHDEAQSLQPKVDENERVVGLQQASRRHMQEAYDNWVRDRDEALRTVDICNNDLKTLGEAVAPDENRIAELRNLISIYAQTEAKIMALRQEVAVQDERSKNTFRAMTNSALEVDKLRGRLVKEPHKEEVEKARARIGAHEEARANAARAEGELTQISDRQKQVRTMLTQRKAEEAQIEGLKTYRTLCERARTLLHRDNLPNMVAQAYMKSLNAHLEHYLEVFDVPFRARMMEDTSIVCQFGKREIPAGRLSGGQRVALGLTWRFAVHALFVNHLGLMILDEPTVFLDRDRVDSVYKLLEKVKSYSKSAELQVLVSTHEGGLAGAFDQVMTI